MRRLTTLALLALVGGCPSSPKQATPAGEAAAVKPGDAADPQVLAKVRWLASGTAKQRWQAHHALAKQGSDALPSLLALLRSPDPALRQGAASGLGAIGAPGARAFEPLVGLLGDKQPAVRLAAMRSLRKLRPKAERIKVARIKVARIKVALGDADRRVRHEAVALLGQRAPKDAVKWLTASLSAKRAEARVAAAQGLAQLGKVAVPALAKLLAAADDEAPDVREAVCSALARVAPERAEVATALGKALSDKTAFVRMAAAGGLGLVAPHAGGDGVAALVGPLAVVTADPNALVRKAACEALGAIGVPAKLARPALEKALASDARWQVRAAAAAALGKLGDPAAVAPLSKAVVAKKSAVGCAAAKALVALSPRVPAAKRALARAARGSATEKLAVACAGK